MSASNSEASGHPRPTVFLSYASEDRPAAQLIRDTLPGFGMEVWYDESELIGGDSWDQKIRRQIRECDYFMPVISASTEARHEGYFRREWRLAVERTLDMADDHVFLLPVVIDATAEAGARVPDKFRAVQWLRVPEGRATPALEAVCRRLVSGDTGKRPSPAPQPARRGREESSGRAPPRPAAELPAFPREEPGQRVRFWFQVAGWALHSAWIGFSRFPKWVRILIYCWAAVLLLSRGCSSSDRHHEAPPPRISSTQAQKLKEIAAHHPGNWTAANTTQLLTQIAKEIPAAARDEASTFAPVLAIPFAAPPGDAAAQNVAGSVFTQVYGRLAITRRGKVALAEEPLQTLDASAAMAQGRAHGSSYIVYGAVAGGTSDEQLTVKVITVADGSVLWSKSYPLAGADAAAIAADVIAKLPATSDDDD
jgi:TolB-like protein